MDHNVQQDRTPPPVVVHDAAVMERGHALPVKGELAQMMADPNAVIEIAMGPPFPELVPQQPGTGVQLGRQFANQPTRFVFKKAHLSREDFRVFDHSSKRLVCVSHHHGKNPYESLDPLGIGSQPYKGHNMLGEMESMCHVTGYGAMPSFKVRPKALSMHGRQLAIDGSGRTMFSVGKISRVKTMSLRHNLEVCIGENSDEEYVVEADLMGRTLAFKNKANDMVAFAAKSTKALITTQIFGQGSEMLVDVAPGVDWTAIVGIMMVLQQVGAHYLKDLFDMFVIDPLQEGITDMVTEATGTQGVYNQAQQYTNQAMGYAAQGQRYQQQFNHMNNYY